MAFFDSHTHLYMRGAEDLERMAAAGVQRTAVCAFLPVKPSGAATLKDLFRWLCEVEVPRQAQHGIKAYVAVGVHPRCIPDAGLDAALKAVDARLSDGSATLLGEVGLETGAKEEVEVFGAQLEMARARGAPIIVHTPRAQKARVLEQLLPLLEKAQIEPGKVVIDHLTGELVGKVRERGFCVGLTVQPGKLSPEDVLAIVRELGSERIVVNSDAAHVAADVLAVPHVASCLTAAGLPAAEIARITWENASALVERTGR